MKRTFCAVGLAALCLTWVAPGRGAETPGQKCAVAKNKAAAKKVGAKLKCWEQALAKGAASADMACLMAAETKFTTAIMKAEAKGGCAETGDAGRIESAVDMCVGNLVALAQPVACQVANLVCHCGNVTITFNGSCGSSPQGCNAARDAAVNGCALNGQSAGDCPTAPCTDACTGQPCG
jgi:hypothetical protein